MTRKWPNHTCERAREHVSLRLDGELSQFEDAELDLHLAGCEACRSHKADLAAFTELLHAAPLEPLPFPIVLPRQRRLSVRQLQVAAAAAIVALVSLGSVLGGVGGREVSRVSIGLSDRTAASNRHVRPAYLDSPDYEQRLMAQARAAHSRLVTGSGVPL